MVRLNAKNNAYAILSTAVDSSDSVIQVDDASVFPDVPFLVSIEEEIMLVTSVDGNELTVDRGHEDTTITSHDIVDSLEQPMVVENRFTAGTRQAIYDEIDELADDINTHKSSMASETELGHIKVGENLTIENDGTLNVEGSLDSSDVVEVIDGTISLSEGKVFSHDLISATTYAFEEESDKEYQSFKIILKTGESVYPIIFPSNIVWHEKTVPELSETNTNYILEFMTENEGNDWYGKLVFVDLKKFPEGYVWATDDDFSGDSDGAFMYIGNDGKVAIPHVIKGVPVTSYVNMFAGTNVSGVYSDNDNVTAMNAMFFDSSAETLDLSSFDTSNVTSMNSMFFDSSAEAFDLSSFDTSNVTSMSYMFYDTSAETLDLSSFDTSNVTSMNSMFQSSSATTGYARTQSDADNFNDSPFKPSELTFVVK